MNLLFDIKKLFDSLSSLSGEIIDLKLFQNEFRSSHNQNYQIVLNYILNIKDFVSLNCLMDAVNY